MRYVPAHPRLVLMRGYTLMEILVVIVILGIAGALVIPAMGQTGIIKIQGAVRQVVSDLTFAQADAVAFQERRAVLFDVPNSSYTVVQVPGNAIDANANTLYDPTRPGGRFMVDFRDDRYGDARITSADFGGGNPVLIFDGLGGPIESPFSNNPGPGGTIRLAGAQSAFLISVEAFTGRITVQQQVVAGP